MLSCLFVPELTYLMKDWKHFSLTTRKSTYPQYSVELKSPSVMKSKKTLRIASRIDLFTAFFNF